MARSIDAKCRKCRRAGEKLFLKGDRCSSPKCAVIRKPYAPGVHGKKKSRGLSEYGKQLAMKQRIKRIYGVLERQFRKHFDEIKNMGKTQPSTASAFWLKWKKDAADGLKNLGFYEQASLDMQKKGVGEIIIWGISRFRKITIHICGNTPSGS